MDCNKCTSWDAYCDSSDEESKTTDDKVIIDAKIDLFLRKYTSFPMKVSEKIFFNNINKKNFIKYDRKKN